MPATKQEFVVIFNEKSMETKCIFVIHLVFFVEKMHNFSLYHKITGKNNYFVLFYLEIFLSKKGCDSNVCHLFRRQPLKNALLFTIKIFKRKEMIL